MQVAGVEEAGRVLSWLKAYVTSGMSVLQGYFKPLSLSWLPAKETPGLLSWVRETTFLSKKVPGFHCRGLHRFLWIPLCHGGVPQASLLLVGFWMPCSALPPKLTVVHARCQLFLPTLILRGQSSVQNIFFKRKNIALVEISRSSNVLALFWVLLMCLKDICFFFTKLLPVSDNKTNCIACLRHYQLVVIYLSRKRERDVLYSKGGDNTLTLFILRVPPKWNHPKVLVFVSGKQWFQPLCAMAPINKCNGAPLEPALFPRHYLRTSLHCCSTLTLTSVTPTSTVTVTRYSY